jgi:hypothetical protein
MTGEGVRYRSQWTLPAFSTAGHSLGQVGIHQLTLYCGGMQTSMVE